MYTFMIGSLVFSVFIKVCKNLKFSVITDFWPNNLLLEYAQLCVSKKTTEFLWRIRMQAYYKQEPP